MNEFNKQNHSFKEYNDEKFCIFSEHFLSKITIQRIEPIIDIFAVVVVFEVFTHNIQNRINLFRHNQ